MALPTPLPLALRHAALLVAVGGLTSLAVNAARPDGLPLRDAIAATSGAAEGASCVPAVGHVADVTYEEARILATAGASFVDARPGAAYALGHVEGAHHLPSRGDCPAKEQVLAALRLAPVVIVYDADGDCALARPLADRLANEGVTDVRVLLGGFPAWKAADAPSASGTCDGCGEEGW